MRILTNFKALGISPEEHENDPEGLRKTIFDALESAYLNQAQGDWYLYQDWDPERFLFGSENPELLKAQASNWENEIRSAVLPALKTAGILDENGRALPDHNFCMGTSRTFDARKALEELDNCWTPTGEHAAYLPNDAGYAYFRVFPDQKMLDDIQAAPESYIIFDAFPK